MSFTLGDVVTAARDRHPAFAKPNVPDAVFARFLSDWQRTLYAKAVQRDPSFALATVTTNAPIDPTVQVTLPPYERLVGGTVTLSDPAGSTEPLTLVGYHNRFRPMGRYVAVVTGQTVTWQGSAPHWSDVASVILHYVPEPADFAALTDVCVLPDSARPAMVAHAAFMAGSRVSALPGLPAVDVPSLAATAQEAETQWLTSMGAMQRNRVHRMRARHG